MGFRIYSEGRFNQITAIWKERKIKRKARLTAQRIILYSEMRLKFGRSHCTEKAGALF